MKKLLVAAMGIAAAYGAFADPYINAVRFTGSGDKTAAELNALAQSWNDTATGTYVAAPADTAGTNQYAITVFSESLPSACPLDGDGQAFEIPMTTALSVKTQFGKPLEFNVDPTPAGKDIGDGLYFDSLVKFTVCDDDPAQEYSDAKIVMWLQEATNSVGDVVATNIMVKAGYLSVNDGVKVTPTVYTCNNVIGGDFADKWHRVTIKAIKDITAGSHVPGFAIYIDGVDKNATDVGSTAAKWDNTFAYDLTEAADYLNKAGKLFPSMKQGGAENRDTLSCVAFDGTGYLNDLVVTDQLPDEFAKDHEANKAKVKIGDQGLEVPYESLEEMLDAVNEALAGGSSVSVTLLKGMTIATPLEFTGSGTLTLDFAGVVLTNDLAVAAITNSAAKLIVTDSVGTGGIVCSEDVPAIYQSATSADAISVVGGNFWGAETVAIKLDANYTGSTKFISGGAFASDMSEDAGHLVDGKIFGTPVGGLYPVIDYVPATYTITFYAHGGDGSMEAMTVTEGDTTNLTANAFTLTGYTFAGWSTDGEGQVEYLDGAEVTPTGSLELYAEWNINTYTVKFVYGLNKEYTNTVTGVTYNTVPTLPANPDPAYAVEGYNITWPTFVAVTADATYEAVYTPIEYTITYKTAEGNDFTYWATSYTAPGSFTVEAPATLPVAANVALVGGTFNGWTNAVGQTVADTAGLTENLVVFANVTAGSTNWVDNPEQIAEDTPASTVYSELTGSALESTDAKKLTVWAKANGKTVGAVAEAAADSDLYDAYLLNCTEAQLETAKENFKIPSITFDENGKPVVAEPTGSYNGTIQQKGSNDLSTWTVIDGSTYEADDFQFFKLELVP